MDITIILEREGKSYHKQIYLLEKPREKKDGQGCNSSTLFSTFPHSCELFPHQYNWRQ